MKHIYIATGVTALVGGLITAAMISSCNTECTMEARASVVLQFINTATAGPEPELLGASEVWFDFTDDNGQTETLRGQCMDDECTEWVLGFERPGTYAVHATVCGEEYSRELSVGMTEDGCHVETAWEQIEVDGSKCPPDLEPADEIRPPGSQCSHEARYSVIVDVVGDIEGRDHPVATDRRYFKWSGDTDPRQRPGSCLNEDCSKFAAGVEQEGHFEVGAEVCGEVVAQTVAVEKTDDDCHVDTQTVTLRASLDSCDEEPKPLYPPSDPICTIDLRPSAIVMPVVDGGDVWMPYPTEQMWFEQGGTRHKAYCAGELDQNGKCTRWITGWELDGQFTAFTETCDEITKVEFEVGKTIDGCHVETVYVPVFMDTHGCIQSPQPPSAEPIPVLTSK